MIGLGHYLTVAAILFTLGIFGIFLNRKNVIVILMSVELMLLAVNINLVAFSVFLQDLVGQVFAMFVLTVAAGGAGVGPPIPPRVPSWLTENLPAPDPGRGVRTSRSGQEFVVNTSRVRPAEKTNSPVCRPASRSRSALASTPPP